MITHIFLSEKMRKQFLLEYSDIPTELLQIGLNEFYKFMQISLSNKQLQFFPLEKFIDDIWHSYIVQTEEYSKLCNLINPGKFLHHESMSFTDYKKIKTIDEIRNEDMSWLGMYYNLFGEFDKESIKHWILPHFLSHQMGWNIEKINTFSKTLAIAIKTGIPYEP